MAEKIDDLMAKMAIDTAQYEQITRRIEADIAQLWDGVPSASELQERLYNQARPIYHDYMNLIQTAPSSTEADAACGMVLGATDILYKLGVMDRDACERVGKRAIAMVLTRQLELSK